MKRLMNTERSGFAITFEIMMTTLLVALVCSVTTYFAQAFELERFFADVTSSTCVMASRYGGNESNAYKIQVGSNSNIEDTANSMLIYVASHSSGSSSFVHLNGNSNGKYITVSDYPDKNGNVTVRLSYSISPATGLASAFSIKNTVNQSFTLPSIMQSGRLLTGR